MTMVKLKPIARSSLVDAVVEQVRALIEKGPLLPGARLPSESELGERLQVSRSVLREAMSRLETMGLVTVQRGRGMFVGDRSSLTQCLQLVRSALTITPRELSQLAEFRAAIECHTVRRAAERATAADLDDLTQILDAMDRVDQDHHESIRLDFQFHRKLVEMAGNTLMLHVIDVIQEFVLAGMVQTTPQPRNRENSRRLHRAIFDAVAAHDPDSADKAMRQHMARVEEALQRTS